MEVLAVVHQENIIHRDIKPQNIMRRQDGKIILIDFGAVKEVHTLVVDTQGQSSLTVTIGSPGYMPTEQAGGRPKISSDIFAVGMLGIYALTGIKPDELPKDPATEEVIWRNLVTVSDKLAQTLTKMVKYHFKERYQSAEEALKALIDSSLSPSQPTPGLKLISKQVTVQTAPQNSRIRLVQTVGLVGICFSLGLSILHLLFPSILSNKESTQSQRLTYTVKSGDTLESIAEKFCSNRTYWELIVAVNPELQKRENRLEVDQVLKIPVSCRPRRTAR